MTRSCDVLRGRDWTALLLLLAFDRHHCCLLPPLRAPGLFTNLSPMLVEASDHLVALRDPPVNGEHRHVCLQRLLQLLRDTTGFDPKTKTGTNKTKGKNITKSKKRSHDEDGSSDDGSLRKRAKVLSGNAIKVTADERLLPVYQRVLRLRYSTSPDVPNLYPFDYVDDERAADLGWINVEQTLREWVSNYVASKGDTSPIPLGPVSVDSLVHGVY